jgi:hypothetical protein
VLEFVRDIFVHPESSHRGPQINLPQRIWIIWRLVVSEGVFVQNKEPLLKFLLCGRRLAEIAPDGKLPSCSLCSLKTEREGDTKSWQGYLHHGNSPFGISIIHKQNYIHMTPYKSHAL